MRTSEISEVKTNQSLTAFQQRSNMVSTGEQTKVQSASGSISIQAANLQQNAEEAQSKQVNTNGVELEISRQMLDMYRQQLEASKENEDAAMDLAKIMEIARRISNGHKVPASDEKKLLEHNFKLYMAAKNAAVLNAQKKRKKYKALFDEDKDKDMREQIRELNRHSNGDTIVIAENSPNMGSESEAPAEGAEA